MQLTLSPIFTLPRIYPVRAGDAYPSVPQWALAWPFRLRRILEELAKHSADIIALQVRAHTRQQGGYVRVC